MTTNKRGFGQQLWDFFCSLKLSITLLILLAVTSIIGTVIPQSPPAEYLATISQTKIKIYSAMGFFDMYHSWWFILLLYLLTVNLVACSIKRLPRVWKIVSEPALVLDEGLEKSLSLTHDFKVQKDVGSLREKLSAFLKNEFAAPTVTEVNGVIHLFSQKNPWCRLGVYVVHLSIIIIFIGALLGSFFGYKGYMQITEGTSTPEVYKQGQQQPIVLPFALRCEKFTVSYYDTGAPKEFKSILTVLENGQPVQGYTNIPTIVNDPLSYKGVTFYQSSYGVAGEEAAYQFTVRPRTGGSPAPVTVHRGERTSLPGGGSLKVLEATEEVRAFIPEMSGPAAKVEYTSPSGQSRSFLVFKNFPELDEKRGGDMIFTYDGSNQKFYTGLQVSKDPGVLVVWLGCALMVIGICMAFFMSHKRVWIRIDHGRVVMAGTASKNPAAFQLAFDNLVTKLNQQQ